MDFRSRSIARVIGVIDLRDGLAVHAHGGRRDEYQPIGDAVELARVYADREGVHELYVADLDAIGQSTHDVGRPFQGRQSGAQSGVPHIVNAVAALGATVWLDAGISSVDRARQAIDAGAAHVVVGLETLPSFTVLREICDAAGRARVAFSLDLRGGEPLGVGHGEDAAVLARRAVDSGAGAIIVLDLARVGMRSGLDLALISRVNAAASGVELVAGGGVRDADDLARLADAGCDAALVGTALRDGSLAALKGPPHESKRP